MPNGASHKSLYTGGFVNMEYTQITKQMLNFQKMSFDSWYNAVSVVQDQAVSNMGMMLNQAAWIPEDGRNAIQSWVQISKEERNRLKSYVDMGFAAIEKSISSGA
jgi:hypothetical protein